MTIEPATFGAQLRRQRLAAALTQEELAERSGLSTRGIQDLERGIRRLPHPDTIRRLTAALGRLDIEVNETPPAVPVLPAAVSSFVGRERDIAELGALLSTTRLITLTGPGGIGKTQLALKVASGQAEQYAGRVWLADLSPLVDGQLVADDVATALGLREQPVRTRIETVCEFLGNRAALLVLDNCEHLLPACVTVVDTLMRRCPELRVLATSREPLRVSDEVVWRVRPLGAADAAKLFVERATTAGAALPATESSSQAIADVCRRLEGVPLAIELAAGRAAMFSVEQIVSLLDDAFRLLNRGSQSAPARHQSLFGLIAWSYDLLPPAEQVLLERLSVFAGGWSFQAAQAVAEVPAEPFHSAAEDDALARHDILDLLGRLVDRSLVVAEPAPDGTTRYRLQEVLRQFSHEQLVARGDEEAVRTRHASYFMHVVLEAERRGLTGERRALLDRIELELDNLRAARRWFATQGAGKAAQRFEAALYRLLMYRGHATEGRQSLLAAVALHGGSRSTRAKALQCLGALAYTQADYAEAAEYHTAGLALHRQIDDPFGLMYAFAGLGRTASARGDFAAAEGFLDEARRASRRAASQPIIALCLAFSASMEYMRGQFDAARRFAQEAIEAGRETGFASPKCIATVTLGNLSHDAGDWYTAADLLSAALTEAEDTDETYLIVRAAMSLALLLADMGDMHGARTLLDDSLGRALQLGNRHHIAQVLEGVAVFAASQPSDAAEPHAQEAALRFAAAAAAIRTVVGAPRSPTEERLLEARLDPVRQALGDTRTAATSAEGTTWPIDLAARRARDFLSQLSADS